MFSLGSEEQSLYLNSDQTCDQDGQIELPADRLYDCKLSEERCGATTLAPFNGTNVRLMGLYDPIDRVAGEQTLLHQSSTSI